MLSSRSARAVLSLRKPGIEALNLGADRTEERGVRGGPNLEVHRRDAVDWLEIGHVETPYRLVAQIMILRVMRHADDLQRHVGRPLELDVLANRALVRKVEARHGVVDDRHAGGARSVALREIASKHKLSSAPGSNSELIDAFCLIAHTTLNDASFDMVRSMWVIRERSHMGTRGIGRSGDRRSMIG